MNNKEIVSFDNEMLIVVDQEDTVLGYLNKKSCHSGEGVLHRAFSIFIFNQDNHLLLQQRSQLKHLWPQYWANSCCSHPRQGEELTDAVKRRVKEELGLGVIPRFLFKFSYDAKYKNEGSERELCHVFIGKSDDEVKPNEREVMAVKFVDPQLLDDELNHNPESYTPWLQLEWPRIRAQYWMRVLAL